MSNKRNPAVWCGVFANLKLNVIGDEKVVGGDYAVYVMQVSSRFTALWQASIEHGGMHPICTAFTAEECQARAAAMFERVLHPWREGTWDQHGWQITPATKPAAAVRP